MERIQAFFGAGLVVLLFIGALLYLSVYTIDQGERGVLLRTGAIRGTAEPGFGMQMPILDSVVRISVQSRSVKYDRVEAYSKDQQPAILVLSVIYRIPADQVAEVYEKYGSEEALISRLVERKLFEESKSVFGQFNAVTAIQERTRLNFEISEAVRKGVDGPVIVDSVQIENIDFSDAYESSIEQRMLAEVEVQKLRQNAEREKIQAEIVVTQAQARADAVRAQAQADADAIRLRGDAEAHAIAARAQALSDNPNLIELVKAEKWDGKLPTTMVPGGALPLVNVR